MKSPRQVLFPLKLDFINREVINRIKKFESIREGELDRRRRVLLVERVVFLCVSSVELFPLLMVK